MAVFDEIACAIGFDDRFVTRGQSEDGFAIAVGRIVVAANPGDGVGSGIGSKGFDHAKVGTIERMESVVLE